MSEKIDWATLEKYSEQTCYCLCGETYRSHAKAHLVEGRVQMVTKKPCPACGKTVDHCRKISDEGEPMTLDAEAVRTTQSFPMVWYLGEDGVARPGVIVRGAKPETPTRIESIWYEDADGKVKHAYGVEREAAEAKTRAWRPWRVES